MDSYTENVLRERFEQHKQYVMSILKIKKETNIPLRLPGIPEDMSENFIKFILHYQCGDVSSCWSKGSKKKSGDLFSKKEGCQECKCFTSNGPISFGPTEKWNVLYFLDGRKWLENKFVLWRLPLENTPHEWKNIKLNKNQKYEDQTKQGRRPRLTWILIHKQLGDKLQKVYDGNFEDIFIPSLESIQLKEEPDEKQ